MARNLPGWFSGACAAIAIGIISSPAAAQKEVRGGKWEGSVQLKYTDSKDIHGSSGSEANIDDAYALGLGFAYNFNDHLSLGGDFSWSQPDYTATVTPAAGNGNNAYTVSGTMEVFTAHAVATWNLFARPFTPFVSAGIGGVFVDTNIPSGPPVDVCWYDPWWGYYCGTTSAPTHNKTYFSYNAGAGLRWDSKDNWFVRGLVAQQWMDVGGDVGSPSMAQVRLDFGLRFR
jgi:opacity protein-like surface antigen